MLLLLLNYVAFVVFIFIFIITTSFKFDITHTNTSLNQIWIESVSLTLNTKLRRASYQFIEATHRQYATKHVVSNTM